MIGGWLDYTSMPEATEEATSSPRVSDTIAKANTSADDGPFAVMRLPLITTRLSTYLPPAFNKSSLNDG